MEYKQRAYPLFSACGLNCGLCPRYQMDGVSKCPGCSGKDFLSKHPPCGVLSCSQRKELAYCYMCDEFPCKKYNDADKSDSFITHINQFKDMKKAKSLGIDCYKKELTEKIAILESLLANYDDGRRKGFFCIAVNLLELQDVKTVMERIEDQIPSEMLLKEKAKSAVQLFQEMADMRNIVLKLRKKSSQ